MHRRARHLNPKDAGAFLALDSRFISGVSDGSSISSWTSRTGSNDASQATSANQPVYKTNIVSGQPVVRFTKSSLQYMRTGNGPFGTTSGISILAVASVNAIGSPNYQTFLNHGDYATYTGTVAEMTCDANSRKIASMAVSGSTPSQVIDSASQSQNSFFVATSRCSSSGALNLNVNGVSIGNGSTLPGNINNLSTPVGIGARGTGTVAALDALDGDIGQIIYAASDFGSSLLKLIRHASAFSFKIACS